MPEIGTSQALRDFMLYNRAARLARKTLRFYEGQLKPFVIWCDALDVGHVSAITPSLIRGYLVSLEDRGLRDNSIHAAARAIRAWLNFCVREEYIQASPMDKVAMPRVSRKILPSLSEENITCLLAACNSARDNAIVLVLLDTGLRASELVNLDGKDVDLDFGEIHVRQGKGSKDRTVFLGSEARRALRDYYVERGEPEENHPVWISQTRHQRLTASGLHQLLKRLGEQAGVDDCAPHTMRRTFALWCLRNGMDIFRLARLMGHTDISVLRRYLYLLKDDLRAAHAQYGVVDKLLQ